MNKLPTTPTQLEIINKVDEIIDQKQDVLTAGEGINIAASVDYDVINGWEYESYSQMSVYGLAYGNNKFVKMTNLGATYLSDDGSSWSSGGSLGGMDWQNLAFGYNSFVAINFSGSTAYSSSGSTWVVTSASDTGLGSNYWTGITYGNNKYVVIGATGYVSTSENGSIWTTPVQSTNLGNNDWKSIAYFDNKFVAISSQGYVATSYDGVNWSVATQNANLGNNDWRMISHTNTQLFAISKYGYVSTSKDGENWSIATQNSVLSASGQYWQRVACSNSIMIAVTYMNYTCKNEPTNVTLISTVGGGSGSSTDVQINGTSITSNNVANILTNSAYDSTNNKIATMSDVPTVNNATLTITQGGTTKGTFTANASSNVTIDLDSGSAPSNMVTKDTTQNITGEKTFLGDKRVKFKQSTSTNKLGFTLYDNNGNEKGYLEFNPSNTVDSAPLMTLGNYATSSTNITQVGFSRYSSVSGANGAYNLLTPLIADAKSPFSLTTTYTNFYMPLGFKNGSTQVTTAKSGVADLSTLFPTIATSVSSSSTNAETVGAKLFYDTVGNIETALNTINSGS